MYFLHMNKQTSIHIRNKKETIVYYSLVYFKTIVLWNFDLPRKTMLL